MSGSIRQSEPGSPASPASPASPELTRAASPASLPGTDPAANFMGAFVNRMAGFWQQAPLSAPVQPTLTSSRGTIRGASVPNFGRLPGSYAGQGGAEAMFDADGVMVHPRLHQTLSRVLMAEPEPEALISGDITVKESANPEDPNAKTEISANLKFNTLDMIGQLLSINSFRLIFGIFLMF